MSEPLVLHILYSCQELSRHKAYHSVLERSLPEEIEELASLGSFENRVNDRFLSSISPRPCTSLTNTMQLDNVLVLALS